MMVTHHRFVPQFSLPRQGKAQYEVLLDENERQHQKYWTNAKSRLGISALLVLALTAPLFLRALSSSSSSPLSPTSPSLQEETANVIGEHTIPTMLSVVNHETGKYLFALDNPLYEQLKTAKFITYQVDDATGRMVQKRPTLSTDRFAMRLRDPLTLSWTKGMDLDGAAVLKDTDLIVLYCDDQIWESDDFWGQKQFIDAATIEQARATHQKHNDVNGVIGVAHEEQWHIPSFPVLRHDVCQFALFQELPGNTYALLDTSDAIQIDASRTTPTAIHLALGDDPSEMLVQFTTGDESGGTPVARYSKEGSKDHKKATGTTRTYTADDMCEEPANVTEAGKFQAPGMLHAVRLTDLEPNTVYQYKVGLTHGQGITWSDSFSFTSAPKTGDQEAFSYIVYGDQGCPANGWGSGGAWTAAMATREIFSPEQTLPIRAVHHFGDLSYAKGAAHVWDEWLEMVSAFTTAVPLMIAVGNHEYDHVTGWDKDPSGEVEWYHPDWSNWYNDSGGECGVPTVNHFTMPNTTESNSVFWYSFDFGNTHTIIISTEHELTPGSRQYIWLEHDLKSVNRTATPWVIVETHRPLYESEEDFANNAVGIARRGELEDLFYDYNVDLFLAGHYHSYLRTCDGLYNSRCDNGGPTHITIGSAGASLNNNSLYDNDWTAKFIKQEYGYGRITVVNASALRFQFVKAGDTNDTTAGEIHDDFWIWRDR